jgi:biotin transport system ATP-binding protein
VLAHLDDLHDDGTAVLVVTHDLRDLLGRADRLLGMDGGRLVADVPPAEARDALEGIAVRVPKC